MGETRDQAICAARPEDGVGLYFRRDLSGQRKSAGLVLPSCDSEAMALHLEEISLAVAPGAHAILLLDQAGWHVSKKLPIPDNITLLPFPPKSPELNPVENIWQFMRDNWLSKTEG
jgi:transposase